MSHASLSPEVLSKLDTSLSAEDRRILGRHPDEVRAELERIASELRARENATLLEIKGKPDRFMSEAEAEAYWNTRTQPPQHDFDVLSSDEVAARLGLKTRQSVLERVRAGRLIGWQGERRGYVFPAEQITPEGRPVPGLEHIRPRFDSAEAAWWWLTTPCPGLNRKRPLDCLREGEIGDVVFALEGYVQGAFG